MKLKNKKVNMKKIKIKKNKLNTTNKKDKKDNLKNKKKDLKPKKHKQKRIINHVQNNQKIINISDFNNIYYENFKNFCIYKYKLLKPFEIPNFNDNSINQTAFIYFDTSEHIKFIIKNMILKLGEEWSHNIICNDNNYNFILNIVNNISTKIKIIKLDKSELNNTQVLMEDEFWNKIICENIIIYNEYSCLFKGNNNILKDFDFYANYSIEELKNIKKIDIFYCKVPFMKNILNKIRQDNSENFNELLENIKIDLLLNELDKNKTKIGNNLMFSEDCRKINFDENWLESKIFKICAFTTNYGLNLGGGEINLLNFAKYFILKKHSIIYLFVDENLDIKFKTTKLVLGEDLIDHVKFFGKNGFKHINQNYDYHFNMDNSKIPRLRGLSSNVNIYHCQFPFDTYKDVENKKKNNIKNYNHIFLNSDFTEFYYKKFTNRYLNNQKINVIYPSSIKNIKIDDIDNYEKKENSFVMIGRIFDYNTNAHNKNFDIALKYFENLSFQNNHNFEIHIIGKVYSNKMLNKLKSFKIKNIYFHTNCSDDEKNKILEKSQYILNMTGLNRNNIKECFAYEHFGISIIEGINYGCIPISVNGGYPSYYIKNNENGYIFNNEMEFNDLIRSIILKNKKILFDKIYYKNILEKFKEEYFFKKIDSILN